MAAKKRLSLSIAVMAALVVMAGVAGWQGWGRSDAKASRSELFGDAIAELNADDGSVAAIVNGTNIPESKIRAFMVFNSAGASFGQTGQPKSLDDYVNQLVDQELMFQEARRRDLVPSDAEVTEFARITKAGLQELLSQDTAVAKDLRAVFDQVKGTEYHVDAYDTSEVMLDSFRKQMAIGALRNELMSGSPADVLNDANKREQVFKAFVSELRKNADVQILLK